MHEEAPGYPRHRLHRRLRSRCGGGRGDEQQRQDKRGSTAGARKAGPGNLGPVPAG
ncbi:MAG: hypothetical protein LGB78_08270 [Sulfurovum sp.]|nr:hypothetical protein [Sulfurovum sp.]